MFFLLLALIGCGDVDAGPEWGDSETWVECDTEAETFEVDVSLPDGWVGYQVVHCARTDADNCFDGNWTTERGDTLTVACESNRPSVRIRAWGWGVE